MSGRVFMMCLFAMCASVCSLAADSDEIFVLPPPDPTAPVPWNLDDLYKVPPTYPAPEFEKDAPAGMTPLFFKNEDYLGKETRAFAWVGIPEGDGPFPAMVLVHGGGGAAFKEWVQIWMDRGYAAIAADTAGQIPIRPEGKTKGWLRHDHSGPRGWGDFESADKPKEEQWFYHAEAAVIRAHSLLRSYPQVDTNRVGITGISWGGHLTSVAAGLDDRFKLAVPVYGCGFLGEDSFWLSQFFRPMGREKTMRWLSLWDASRYVGRAKIPMLFVNGTNDKHYRPGSWQKTCRLVPEDVSLAYRVRMSHGHESGWAPEEIYTFADSVFKGSLPLTKITGQGRVGQTAWVAYDSPVAVEKAELNFTSDTGEWPQRFWNIVDVPVDSAGSRVEAPVPAEATAYYMNIYDSRGLVSSSELEELNP